MSAAAARAVRGVARTWPAREVAGGGQSFRKRIVLMPSEDMRQFDPFLLMAEDWMRAPGGFDDHPHRGFCTFTIVLEGRLAHSDRVEGGERNRCVLEAGDVQWTTAGGGIVHSELPDGDGVCHVFQLWINLPRATELCTPEHIEARDSAIPRVALEGEACSARVLAGRIGDVSSPVEPPVDVRILDINVPRGATARIPIAAGHRGFALVVAGSAQVAGAAVPTAHVAWLAEEDAAGGDGAGGDSTGSTLDIACPSDEGADECRVMLFTGAPFGEPVFARGPFVLSSADRLREAFLDAYRGAL